MSTDVIIPTLGQNGYLDGCLASLDEHAPKGTEILIVGRDKPRSFAENCNLGAKESTADYLLFLNDDTQVKSGFLGPLTQILDSRPEVGMVGSRLIYADGSIQHAGIYFDTVGDQLHGFNAQEVSLSSRAVKGVTGACALVRRDEFLEVGGFDEGYKSGNEDCALGLTYLDHGLGIWFCAESVVVHHESKSGPARWAHVGDNVRRFTEQWIDRPDLWKEA